MVATSTHPSLLDAIATYDGHLIGASRTGSGKTTLMLAAIAYIDDVTSGNTEWLCGSGKASVWMGLENQFGKDGLPRVINASLSEPVSIDPLLRRLRWAVQMQERREILRLEKTRAGEKVNPRPIRVVLDEWLILLKVAKRYSKEAYQEMIDLVETIILKGRQDKVFIWLFAQGHHCKTLHLDGDLRTNLGVIALGGAGNYQSVTGAIADHYLIEDNLERDRLQKEYQALLTETPTGRIYYSSIGGHKVARMIDLPDMELEQVFGAEEAEGLESSERLPTSSQPKSKANERERLEEIYQKSPDPKEEDDPQTERLKKLEQQWAIADKELKLKQRLEKLRRRELELKILQYRDGQLRAENKWNLITLGIGVTVFVIYAVPPFSGALQTAWKGAVKVGQAVGVIAEKTDKAIDAFAPALKETPKVKEIIAGYEVTSVFGMRSHPVTGEQRMHNGVDLGTPEGTSLYAIGKPGTTVEVKCWNDDNGGGKVATYGSMGFTWQYLHLSKCQPGKQKAGSVIALSGSTGVGTGAHLHIEQKEGGTKIAPQKWGIWWALTGNEPQPVLVRNKK